MIIWTNLYSPFCNIRFTKWRNHCTHEVFERCRMTIDCLRFRRGFLIFRLPPIPLLVLADAKAIVGITTTTTTTPNVLRNNRQFQNLSMKYNVMEPDRSGHYVSVSNKWTYVRFYPNHNSRVHFNYSLMVLRIHLILLCRK